MMVLNPRRRKRAGTRRRKISTAGLRNIRRAARRRAKYRKRHKGAFDRGEAARKAVQKVACAPDSVIQSLRQRFCNKTPRRLPSSYPSNKAAHLFYRHPENYASNPGIASAFTAGFSPNIIADVLPMPIAGFVNNWLQNEVSQKFGVDSWYGRGLVGIATSGVLGAAASMLKKNLGVPVGVGAAAQTLIQVIRDFQSSRAIAATVAPIQPPKPSVVVAAASKPTLPPPAKLSSMDDFEDVHELNEVEFGD